METLHLDPTRTIVAGDWHGNTRWAVAAVARAAQSGAESLLQLGDFAFRFEHEFVDALTTALVEHGMHLWFLRGNHDDTTYLEALPRQADGTRAVSPVITFLPDGLRLSLGEASAVVLGGAGSIDRGQRVPDIEWWEDERLSPALVDRVIAAGPADVVLAHDCPAGVELAMDPSFGAYFARGDPGVIAWCEEHRQQLGRAVDALDPALILHGHHHRRLCAARPGRDRDAVVVGLDCDGTSMSRNLLLLGDVLQSRATPPLI